jgi:transposase, IS5 family
MNHRVEVTPANVHDSRVLSDLLHGEETRVWGDSAYAGQTEAIKEATPKAADFTNKKASRYRQKCARNDRDECVGQSLHGTTTASAGVIRPQYGDSP